MPRIGALIKFLAFNGIVVIFVLIAVLNFSSKTQAATINCSGTNWYNIYEVDYTVSGQSGNSVCSSHGMTCQDVPVLYDYYGSSGAYCFCNYFHPSWPTSSNSSGGRVVHGCRSTSTGLACRGSGMPSGDHCHLCSACNPNMSCSSSGTGPSDIFGTTWVRCQSVSPPSAPSFINCNRSSSSWENASSAYCQVSASGATYYLLDVDTTSPSTNRSSMTYSGQGSHYFGAKACNSGGCSSTSTRNFYLDSSNAGTATISGCTNYTSGVATNSTSSTTCSWSGSTGPSPSTGGYYCYSTSSSCSPGSYDSNWSVGFTPNEGTTYFRANVCDTGGCGGTSSAFTFVVDRTGPSISFVDDVSSTPTQSETIDISYGDSSTAYYKLSTAPSTECNDAGDFSAIYGGPYTYTDASNNGKYVCAYGADSLGNNTFVVSSNTIEVDLINPSITLNSPNGGESWVAGSSNNVTWTATDNYSVDTVDLEYDCGSGFAAIPGATGLSNSGSYSWTLPQNTISDSCLVRSTATDQAGLSDQDSSDAFFSIVPDSPSGTINLTAGDTYLPADNTSTTTINSGVITDQYGNTVADGEYITVSTDLGSITTADEDAGTAGIQISTSSGSISFTLKAGSTTGTATISAASVNGSATGNTTVEIVDYHISGTVFHDADYESNLDGSGYTQAGTDWDSGVNDVAVNGVSVELYDSAGTTLLTSTTTNSSGYYDFGLLIPGDYNVRTVLATVDEPTGTVPVNTWIYNGGDAGELGGNDPDLNDTDTTAGAGIGNSYAAITISSSNVTSNFGFSPFVVTSTKDDGPGSLRQAILNSNTNTGVDDIVFAMNIAKGTTNQIYTIDITSSALAALTDGNLHIDGYSENGAAKNTNVITQGLNTAIRVVVDSSSLSPTTIFNIQSSGNHLEGLSLHNDGGYSAIQINSGSDNRISGNYFNVLPDGVTTNNLYNAIRAQSSSSDTVIGTNGDGVDDLAERNLFSGINNDIIQILSVDSTIVAGNLIGTTASGLTASTSSPQAILELGTNTVIGTDGDGTSDLEERNVIIPSGAATGITLSGTNTIVANNFIGVDVTGNSSLGGSTAINAYQSDNARIGTDGNGTSDTIERNVIGGTSTGLQISQSVSGLIVAGNNFGLGDDDSSAVSISGKCVNISDTESHRIGTDSNDVNERNVITNCDKGIVLSASAGTGNLLSQNLVYGNTSYNIDLSDDNLTINDALDSDTGPNNLINYPVVDYFYLNLPSSGQMTIIGHTETDSADPTTDSVELYVSNNHPSDHGGGLYYFATATPDADAEFTYVGSMNPGGGIPPFVVGSLVSGTTIDANDNTSEYGENFAAVDAPLTGDVGITTPSSVQNSNVPIEYVAANAFDTPADILVEYSDDGGSTFNNATIVEVDDGTINGSVIEGVTAELKGTRHVLVWDSRADLGDVTESDIQIAITVQDAANDTAATSNFTLQNTSPALRFVDASAGPTAGGDSIDIIGDAFAVPAVVTDSFTGSTINSARWGINNSDPSALSASQNDALIFASNGSGTAASSIFARSNGLWHFSGDVDLELEITNFSNDLNDPSVTNTWEVALTSSDQQSEIFVSREISNAADYMSYEILESGILTVDIQDTDDVFDTTVVRLRRFGTTAQIFVDDVLVASSNSFPGDDLNLSFGGQFVAGVTGTREFDNLFVNAGNVTFETIPVTLDSLDCSNVVIDNSNNLSCINPAHAAGLVDLDLVHIDGRTITLNNAFYYNDGPSISSINPDEGPGGGGQTVTFTGTDLGSFTGIEDSFNDGILDSIKWLSIGSASNIEQNNVLEQAVSADGTIEVGDIRSENKFVLEGDFDLRVDFFNFATLGGAVSRSLLVLEDYQGANDVIAEVGINTNDQFEASLEVDSSSTGSNSVAANGVTNGALRITRSGNTLELFQDQGIGFTSILSDTNPAYSQSLFLALRTEVEDQSTTTTSVSWDNVYLASGNHRFVQLPVDFGGTSCTNIELQSDTTLVCDTPAHVPGDFDATILNPDGQSASISYHFNSPPSVTVTQPDGFLKYEIILETYSFDEESDPKELLIEVSVNGDPYVPASIFKVDWVASTDNPITGLTSSPSGIKHEFHWRSQDDAGIEDALVDLRFTPSDQFAVGTPVIISFELSNAPRLRALVGGGGSSGATGTASPAAPTEDEGTQTQETPTYCGNGLLEYGEACDDGNLENGDGCDEFCRVEGDTLYFVESVCGDGDLDLNTEECDDGNTTDHDGCSSECRIEAPEDIIICGNGIIEGEEECDDGNLENGDGCDEICLLEPEPDPEIEVLDVRPPTEKDPLKIDFIMRNIHSTALLMVGDIVIASQEVVDGIPSSFEIDLDTLYEKVLSHDYRTAFWVFDQLNNGFSTSDAYYELYQTALQESQIFADLVYEDTKVEVPISIDNFPPRLNIDKPSGVYEGSFSVNLSSEAGARIYYTTNGSAIDFSSTGQAGSSTKLASGGVSIPIYSDKTLRAVAVDNSGNRGFEQVRDYQIASVPSPISKSPLETEIIESERDTLIVETKRPAAPGEDEETIDDDVDLADFTDAQEELERMLSVESTKTQDSKSPEFELVSLQRGELMQFIAQIFNYESPDRLLREKLYNNLELSKHSAYKDFSINQFYRDVPPSHPNSEAINTLTLYGIVRGRLETGFFEPSALIKNEELLAVLLNASGLFNFEYDFLKQNFQWYIPYFDYARSNDLISQDFLPGRYATRSDMEKITEKIMSNLESFNVASKPAAETKMNPRDKLLNLLSLDNPKYLKYEDVLKFVKLLSFEELDLDEFSEQDLSSSDIEELGLYEKVVENKSVYLPYRHTAYILFEFFFKDHDKSKVDNYMRLGVIPKNSFIKRDPLEFNTKLRYLSQQNAYDLKFHIFECFDLFAGNNYLFNDRNLVWTLKNLPTYCGSSISDDLTRPRQKCLNFCSLDMSQWIVNPDKFKGRYTSFDQLFELAASIFPEKLTTVLSQ